ncbi:MAG: RNA polymerase sigma factor [Gammaproteobacteria bacterium]|nr:RNA polymerase sigma factor [Gammaproteobacteria bacterium]
MAVINMWPIRRSDHQLFEQLMRPHLKYLYRLAYRLTGQQHAAEDLVQEVMLKLFPRLEEIEKIEKLSPWLSKVLYRVFIDQLRKDKRSPVDLIGDDESIYETQPGKEQQPAEVTESEILQKKIQYAVTHLNEDQRILIMLHDVEGYSLLEIQQIQDVPLGTLKSRLNRARAKLREILKEVEPYATYERVKGVRGI